MHQRPDGRDRCVLRRRRRAIVERLLGERLADGGWNCEAENGSVRSSFDTTINVLDGLLAFERVTGGSARCATARRSGEEYLLERGLFRRKSTGEVANPAYLDFAFPYYWHYDVLRALDYFRQSGAEPDPRMAEAVEVVRSKRQPDGRWLLDRIHPGRVHFDLKAAWARRAAGTPCARCGCSTGGTKSPDNRLRSGPVSGSGSGWAGLPGRLIWLSGHPAGGAG